MHQLQPHLDRLAAATAWTYRAAKQSSAEPAAWATLALAAHGRHEAARRPAQWLADLQQADGSVGESTEQPDPRWATSLAMWAWQAADGAGVASGFGARTERAAAWSLGWRGKTAPRSSDVGHDTEIAGWSWASATHSWLEPTCMFVLGLRAAGHARHERVRDGVRLIVDRLLPEGGANYGNTTVLGQTLLAHVQPTGLAMMALAREPVADARLAKSLAYLEQTVGPETSPSSLAFACLGLAAHGRLPESSGEWIAASLGAGEKRLAAYEASLLLLAAAEAPMRHVVDSTPNAESA